MSAVKDPPREAPYNATMRLHDWSCLPQYSRAVQHDMGPNFRVPATAPDMYQTCSGGPVAGGGSAMSLTVRLREGSVFRIRGIKRKLVLPVAMPTRTVHFWCFSPKDMQFGKLLVTALFASALRWSSSLGLLLA